ncbi:MAG: hypothetical protein ACYTGC_18225, partial [Planctomycetota bacterium]
MKLASVRSLVVGLVLGVCSQALGQITVYTDRAEWEAAVSAFSTVGFGGMLSGTTLTDQLEASHGIVLTGGFDVVFQSPIFDQDGAGVDSDSGIRFALDSPRTAVGVHFLDQAQLVLFCEEYEAFFMSDVFIEAESDFFGIVSTRSFDSFVVRGPSLPWAAVTIDDVLLGEPTGAEAAPCQGGGALIGSDLLGANMDSILYWGGFDAISAFSFNSDYCNIGDAVEPVLPLQDLHPVLTMNMYRLMNGRFEQIGMSWVKHTFGADVADTCGNCADPGSFQLLGLGCSDVYSAGQNGNQVGMQGMMGLGPRSDINPATGEYPFPYTTQGVGGNALYKRLQVAHEDLLPELNVGAVYLGGEHFIARHDAQAGNGYNNMCYRPIAVSSVSVLETRPGRNPLEAWQEFQPSVTLQEIDVEGDGRLVLGFDCSDNGDGTWHYEYALYNLNSHRAAGSFTVPIDPDTVVTNIGFHDIDYHSGEAYDSTDWTPLLGNGQVTWATDSFEDNQNANALRWAT